MPRLQRGPSSFVQTPTIGPVRELTRGDLQHLQVKRQPSALQTLRDSHHRAARAVASGLSNIQVAETCGISYNRVSMLKQDPAFANLVAHYRAMLTAEWVKEADPVVELLGTIRQKSLAMIEEKIDDAASRDEFLPSRDLATFAELGLDRTGYGKVNKNVNINVDFAAKLEQARKRSASAPTTRQIEGQVTSPALAPQSAPVIATPNPSPGPSFRRL